MARSLCTSVSVGKVTPSFTNTVILCFRVFASRLASARIVSWPPGTFRLVTYMVRPSSQEDCETGKVGGGGVGGGGGVVREEVAAGENRGWWDSFNCPSYVMPGSD